MNSGEDIQVFKKTNTTKKINITFDEKVILFYNLSIKIYKKTKFCMKQ